MNILLILIPLALGLSIVGLLAFFWALRHNQFDDLEGAGQRILEEEEKNGCG